MSTPRNKSARDRWLEDRLSVVPAGTRILDAGAGELQYKALCSHLDYVSQDFCGFDGRGDGSGVAYDDWRQSGVDIVSDICAIPQPAASFGAVLCVEVLEHVPDPVAAVRELARVLAPGGALILTAPAASLSHMSPYYYVSGYSRNWYEHWLPRLGLTIEELTHNGDYFAWLAQELRRVKGVEGEYGGRRLGVVARRLVRATARVLTRLSETDSRSHELLCYGIHVVARRTGADHPSTGEKNSG